MATLSDAFAQVEVTLEQASAILANLAANTRDAGNGVYEALMEGSSNVLNPTPPAAQSSTTTTKTSTASGSSSGTTTT